ncbi:TorD/DmsD family molecular chaperone [Shewanella sp. A14]
MSQTHNYASAVCGVLHNVFYQIPTADFLSRINETELLSAWPKFDTDISSACDVIRNSLETDSMKDIERDYYQLFIGPGTKKAYPWGSVYTDKDNLLFGESTLAVRGFYKSYGIEFELDGNKPMDHFALILGVLSEFFSQENEDAIKLLLGQHLLPWSQRVIDCITGNAKTDFYRGFAQLMQALLNDWMLRLDITPVEMPLYR